MGSIDKNLAKALEKTYSYDEIMDKTLNKYFDAIPFLLEHFSEKDLHHPMFLNFMSKIPDLIREYKWLEFLEDNKDTVEKYPGGEKIARRCLEEIFRARYKPGYKGGTDWASLR
jgi:hypothetical protein